MVMFKRQFALRSYLFLVTFLLVSTPLNAANNRILVINDIAGPPLTTAAHDGFLDVIAAEAFRRVGTTLQLVKLPAERGLINADSGFGDGDMVRIAGLEKLYPNLVRVPEKLMDWEFVAYSKKPDLIVNWQSLRQHVVGHIIGWKLYEHHLKGAEQVVTTNGPVQLFHLLSRDRIDVALYARWIGQDYIKRFKLKGIHQATPPLAKQAMFIYLNKRHAGLVPKLAKALRALKREGFYQRMWREKLTPNAEGHPR